MDWETVAKDSPYFLTTKLEDCDRNNFWVVLLDNGLEVYQGQDNPDLRNSWVRLKAFCQERNLRIVNMAYVDSRRSNQINLPPGADGYFYSRRIEQWFNAPIPTYSKEAEGVGYLDNNVLHVTWLYNDGDLKEETRSLERRHPKHSIEPGLIRG